MKNTHKYKKCKYRVAINIFFTVKCSISKYSMHHFYLKMKRDCCKKWVLKLRLDQLSMSDAIRS